MSLSAVSRPRASVDPGLTFAEVDDATLNGSHIRVLFAVLEANLRQAQPDGRRIGQEQVRSVPDSRLDAVLQEPVRDVHGWAEQFAVGPNGLAHHLAPMEHHLQVEAANRWAGRADVILRLSGLRASCVKGLVHGLELVEPRAAPPVKAVGWRDRKDRVAF